MSEAAPTGSPSGFRSRLASLAPRRDDGSLGPALAAGALVLLLLLQLALPVAPVTPDPVSAPLRRAPASAVTQVASRPAVLATPLFSPERLPDRFSGLPTGTGGGATEGAAAQASGPSPVPSLIGVSLGGRTSTAIVRGPSGATRVLRPGQRFEGWRLDWVSVGAAGMTGPAGRRTLQVGSAPAGRASAVFAGPSDESDENVGNLGVVTIADADASNRGEQ